MVQHGGLNSTSAEPTGISARSLRVRLLTIVGEHRISGFQVLRHNSLEDVGLDLNPRPPLRPTVGILFKRLKQVALVTAR